MLTQKEMLDIIATEALEENRKDFYSKKRKEDEGEYVRYDLRPVRYPDGRL